MSECLGGFRRSINLRVLTITHYYNYTSTHYTIPQNRTKIYLVWISKVHTVESANHKTLYYNYTSTHYTIPQNRTKIYLVWISEVHTVESAIHKTLYNYTSTHYTITQNRTKSAKHSMMRRCHLWPLLFSKIIY